MKFGLQLLNKGPFAAPGLIRDCARIAEALPIDDLWVFDHLAVTPDQSRGSDGYYIEPLATLAFAAAVTEHIGLGTRVLILPYRPAFLTAKWVASLQTLAEGRLRLGVGVGWLEPEFRALGVDRSRRGALTDESLAILHRCLDAESEGGGPADEARDTVEVNGVSVLFRPRPARPPIYVGGAPPHALVRSARFGEGWMPPGSDPDALGEPIAELRRLTAEAGKKPPEVIASAALPADDHGRARDMAAALEARGVTQIAVTTPYETVDQFRRLAEAVARLT